MFLTMSETASTTVATRIDLPLEVHQQLRLIARAEKRSLKSHIEWLIQRHIEVKGQDAA